MNKYVFTIILSSLLTSATLYAQTKLTLEACKEKAVNNYPLTKQYNLISLSKEYSLNNLSKSYLPQLSLNGQITYQSTTTKIPIDFSELPIAVNIPTMNKDQYKTTIDASQLIWDGGNINTQKKITNTTAEVNSKAIDVQLYTIKEKINNLYFGILMINEQLKLLDLIELDMKTNRDMVLSMLKNGVAMQSDLDQIDVELLNIKQNRTEQLSERQAYIKMLSLFIYEELQSDTQFEIPSTNASFSEQINRPEISFYSSQRMLYNMQVEAIKAKNMPRITLFAQGGYGRPGLNMLENRFKLFAIAGVKLNWNLANLYTQKNEKKLIDNNMSDINIQEETFRFNTKMQLAQEQEEVNKLKKLIENDAEIIYLRSRVKTSSESKYKNGISPINDLIRDTNAENQARQTKVLHEIQYLMSIYNYKHIQGN